MRKELRLETCVPTWAPGSPRTSPEERVPTQQSAGQGRFQTDAQRVPVDSRCHRPPASSGCLARSLNLRARSRGPAGRLHPPTHRQRGPVCRGSPRASGGRAPGGVGGYAPQPAGTSQVGARTRGGGEAGAGGSKPRPFPRLGSGSAGRRGSRRRRWHRGGGSGSRPDPGSPALPSGSWLAGTTACSSASSPGSSSAPRGRSRSPIRTLCCWRCTRRGRRRMRR